VFPYLHQRLSHQPNFFKTKSPSGPGASTPMLLIHTRGPDLNLTFLNPPRSPRLQRSLFLPYTEILFAQDILTLSPCSNRKDWKINCSKWGRFIRATPLVARSSIPFPAPQTRETCPTQLPSKSRCSSETPCLGPRYRC